MHLTLLPPLIDGTACVAPASSVRVCSGVCARARASVLVLVRCWCWCAVLICAVAVAVAGIVAGVLVLVLLPVLRPFLRVNINPIANAYTTQSALVFPRTCRSRSPPRSSFASGANAVEVGGSGTGDGCVVGLAGCCFCRFFLESFVLCAAFALQPKYTLSMVGVVRCGVE